MASPLGPQGVVADPLDPWEVLQGEAVEKKGPAIRLGDTLPLITRSVKCPGELAISKAQRRLWDQHLEDDTDKDEFATKEPKIYVLLFPGAADSVTSGWARIEYEAPSYVEFATYEWPGHGVRSEEPGPIDMRQLGADAFETFREAILTGSFITVGHSIGSLISSYVCIRADRELGRQPLASFHLDRPPPHKNIWNEHGYDMLRKQPEEWIRICQPSVAKADRDNVLEEHTVRTWTNNELINNCKMPAGSYKFPCRVFVFIAMAEYAYNESEALAVMDAEARRLAEEKSRLTMSGNSQNILYEWFKEWEEWADQITYNKIMVDHMNMKNHNCMLGPLYRVVKDILKRAELRAARDGLKGGS